MFFISWIWKKKTKKITNSQNNELRANLSVNNDNDEENNLQSSINSDDYCSAKYKEDFRNVNNLAMTIKVRGLVKKFGDFTAVDHLSVSLYE